MFFQVISRESGRHLRALSEASSLLYIMMCKCCPCTFSAFLSHQIISDFAGGVRIFILVVESRRPTTSRFRKYIQFARLRVKPENNCFILCTASAKLHRTYLYIRLPATSSTVIHDLSIPNHSAGSIVNSHTSSRSPPVVFSITFANGRRNVSRASNYLYKTNRRRHRFCSYLATLAFRVHSFTRFIQQSCSSVEKEGAWCRTSKHPQKDRKSSKHILNSRKVE